MKEIVKYIKIENEFITNTFNKKYEYLFFDIETTGFTPKQASLYLIACAFFIDIDTICIKQFFSANISDEKNILEKFLDLLSNFKFIISFNGDNFDIPFIKACLKSYSINASSLDRIYKIDLYKKIKAFKKILALEHLRQKDIESFLKINRKDKYNGKELISIYNSYLQELDNKELLNILLLHNRCDVVGLVKISIFLDFIAFINSKFIFEQYVQDKAYIKLVFKSNLKTPFELIYTYQNIKFNINNNNFEISLPIIRAKLKYFLSNYKDYFYLPFENVAIHKDIAIFVDKSAKIRANKKTAFIEKDDFFIPCCIKEDIKIFSKEYNSKEKFILLNEFNFSKLSQNILDYFLEKLFKK